MPLNACLLALAALIMTGSASAQGNQPSRGSLLYSTHCIACHTTEVHWRGRKLVTDWPSLIEQVRRWQSVQQLGWADEDVIQVARHLNQQFYKVRETGGRVDSKAALPSEGRVQLAARP